MHPIGNERSSVVSNNQRPRSLHRIVRRLIAALLLAALIIGAIIAAKNLGWIGNTASVRPDKDLYQAVFLNNGQVYFGKMSYADRNSLILTDIYYLQVTQPLQQQPPQQAQQNGEDPQVNLVKMGSEIHGPQDKMVIPKASVAFWEDIKPDGTVAKAIGEYQSKK